MGAVTDRYRQLAETGRPGFAGLNRPSNSKEGVRIPILATLVCICRTGCWLVRRGRGAKMGQSVRQSMPFNAEWYCLLLCQKKPTALVTWGCKAFLR